MAELISPPFVSSECPSASAMHNLSMCDAACSGNVLDIFIAPQSANHESSMHNAYPLSYHPPKYGPLASLLSV